MVVPTAVQVAVAAPSDLKIQLSLRYFEQVSPMMIKHNVISESSLQSQLQCKYVLIKNPLDLSFRLLQQF